MGSIVSSMALALLAAARADQDIVPIGNHVAKLAIPIDMTVADPNSEEHVHITGSLLVKTSIRYWPNNPIKVLTSFKPARDLAAVGMTTGDPYMIKGKGTLKYNWAPGIPIEGVNCTGILVSFPVDPIYRPTLIRARYDVDSDPASGDATESLIDVPPTPIADVCAPIAQIRS